MKKLVLVLALFAIACGQASGGVVQTSEAQAPVVDTQGPSVLDLIRTKPQIQLPDNRTLAQIQNAACQGRDGKWLCKNIQQPIILAASSTSPIIPTSWTVSAWWVDPANTSTHASDSNDCVTSTTPCLTWHEINDHRWGCIGSPAACPRLQQITTINILSSQADNTDPVYTLPALEKGSSLIFKGALPTATCTGTLAGVVAKNRATPQLLNATLCGSGAIGQFVINSTHASRAWVYKNVTGSTWAISQPVTAIIPPSISLPTEVNTWANGDSYNSYSLFNWNFVDISPVMTDDINFNSGVYIYNLTGFDPNSGSTFGLDSLRMDQAAQLTESFIQKYITYGANGQGEAFDISNNSYAQIGGGSVSSQSTVPNFTPTPAIWAGVFNAPSAAVPLVNMNSGFFDYDTILGGAAYNLVSGEIGEAYVDTGTTMNCTGGLAISSTTSGGPFLWGPGTFNQGTGGRTIYGGGSATATLKIASLKINGGTTACSIGPGAAAVWNCGITINVTNLDAAFGVSGFAGNAVLPGGGAIAAGSIGNY